MTEKQDKGRSRKETQVRKEKYKELLDMGGVISIGSNIEATDLPSILYSIQGILVRSDEINPDGCLWDRMDNTSEVLMDAQVIKMSHELVGSAIHKFSGVEFNEAEYALRIKRLIGENYEWDKLNDLIMPICKSFRYSQSMFGTFEAEPAVKETVAKQRKQLIKTIASQQVKPNTVSHLQQEEKSAQILNVVLKQLMQMFKINGNTPIPYYKLIVDPESFMKSVDNCFQLSFLFRDGHIIFDIGDDELPNIRPVTDADKASGAYKCTQQFISSLSPQICEDMVARYNIVEPLLVINRGEPVTSKSTHK